MRSDVAFYLGLFFIALVALAFFLPGNPVTSNAILDTENCGPLGCDELCTPGEDEACGFGMTCCAGAWETGLCDYPENCPVIAEFSAEHTIEEYITQREEEPTTIKNIGFETFWLPLLVALAIVGGMIWVTRKKEL